MKRIKVIKKIGENACWLMAERSRSLRSRSLRGMRVETVRAPCVEIVEHKLHELHK
ncbi:MAG: hypothetical protein P4L28_12035 [Paludibacteraceae bacterium]|nr:hypothetical protein [Paludibacteraceae bacterium]